jgi:hypothetical protein
MSSEIDKEYQELVEKNKIAITEIQQKTIKGFITIRRWIDENSFNKLAWVRLIDTIIKSNKLDEGILEELEDEISFTHTELEMVTTTFAGNALHYLNKIFVDNATFEKIEAKNDDGVTFTASSKSSIAIYILLLIDQYETEVKSIEDSLPYKDLDDFFNNPTIVTSRLLFPLVRNTTLIGDIENSDFEVIYPAFRFILKKISRVDLLAIALVNNLIIHGILDKCEAPHEEMIALVGNMVRLILLSNNTTSEQVKVDNTIIDYAYSKLSRDSNINRPILGMIKILLSLVHDPESVVLFDRTMPFFTHMDTLVTLAPGHELEIKVLYLKYLSHIARFGYLRLLIPEKYFKSLYLFDASYECQKSIADVVYCDPLVKLSEMANSIKNLTDVKVGTF